MRGQGVFLLGFLVNLAGPAYLSAQTVLTLPPDTALSLQVEQSVSSANAAVGATVQLQVRDDVVSNGVIVIPHGTVVWATVTEVRSQAATAKGGSIKLKLSELSLKNGLRLPLDLKPASQLQTVSAAVAGASAPMPIAAAGPSPLTASAAGRDVIIPKGTAVTAYIQKGLTISSEKLAKPGGITPAAPARAAGREPLTNEAVLALVQAGMPDDQLIARIKASKANYRLGAADVAALQDASVSQAVIHAMTDSQSRR